MMDQKNATKVRKEALDLAIELLKKLNAHKKITEGKNPSPVNDAIYHAELAAELIAFGALKTSDPAKVREYIMEKTA